MIHAHPHAFASWNPLVREGLTLHSRRNFLKVGMAGLAGLSLPRLLQAQEQARRDQRPTPTGKSIILLWMTGGPSQIDTWDPKPSRPPENRGPFGVTATRLPGTLITDRLPRQAALLDKFTLIRSVDCRHSNHEPNMVMQTANLDAEPRLRAENRLYPAIASVIAKHHGANQPGMPPYVAFMRSRSHLAFAGHLGQQYDPFLANQATRLPIYDLVGTDTGQMTDASMFRLAPGLAQETIHNRRRLLHAFDHVRRELDASGTMAAMDRFQQQAVELLTGSRARDAFDLDREPWSVRQRYGNHLWCQQALVARRLVEAGAAFVTLDLSYHTASGTWDTHGDNIPPYGGILRGLGPLLPLFDHLLTTLVTDLEQRGLLERTLIIAMGEFGRTPQLGTQDSTDGRNHWPVVMSMCLAGGGMRHGQVIGATEADGGQIKERPVTPGDLAATMYHHMGVPLDTTYTDNTGRPRYVVDSGRPIQELL